MTLTLDNDVAAGLKREARRTGRPLRALVNEALRTSLERTSGELLKPFKVEAVDLGVRDGIDLDDIQGLIDRIEPLRSGRPPTRPRRPDQSGNASGPRRDSSSASAPPSSGGSQLYG